MAIKTVTLRTCDRCGRKEEISGSGMAHTGAAISAIEVRVGDEGLLKFEDLCERCTARMQVLLNQMANRPKKEETAQV